MMDTLPVNSTFEEIPVIDLQNALSADQAKREALAKEIREACMNVGFFYVKNHTIPERTINEALNAAKNFFALPLENKMTIDINSSVNFKGYTSLYGENINPQNRGDLHEAFDLGWEDVIGSVREDDGGMTGQNIWPNDLGPGFRQACLEYYHAAVRLGKLLFPLFALALNLPETTFDDKTTKPAAIMRFLHYPPQTKDIDDRVEGFGAHTDFECFTILWQDQVQALQVLNKNDKWIDAVPIPGTLVINLGDQFARWTNDVFKSTMHRASNRSGIERFSIPVFFGTDYNVKLEPLPGCVTADNPAKYEVVTAGEYVRARLEASHGYLKH